jgi:hypothetical protein
MLLHTEYLAGRYFDEGRPQPASTLDFAVPVLRRIPFAEALWAQEAQARPVTT